MSTMYAAVEVLVITSVVIVIAIAASFWLINIPEVGMNIEIIRMVATSAELKSGYYEVSLVLKNNGHSTTTIESVLVNRRTLAEQGIQISPQLPISIQPGEGKTVTLTLPTSGFSSGQSIEVKLLTVTGYEYYIPIRLP